MVQVQGEFELRYLHSDVQEEFAQSYKMIE